MGLAKYAEEFASAGYACLVFDYRRWGASGIGHCVVFFDQSDIEVFFQMELRET
jgi:hypothetical protein